MADEIVYFNDLCYSEHGIKYLSHFRLSILNGETLSIVCRRVFEKKKLFLLLSGSEKFSSGDIYHYGNRLDWPFEFLRKNCFIIRDSSSIVDTLSVAENVFVSSFHRLSSGIVLRDTLVQFVIKKYSEVFGVDVSSPIGELDNYLTQLSVYLERLRLCRPKILICRDPFEKTDDYCRKLWCSFFERIASDGSTVIIVSSTDLFLSENCDRIIQYDP